MNIERIYNNNTILTFNEIYNSLIDNRINLYIRKSNDNLQDIYLLNSNNPEEVA